ncbi:Zinc finger CCCH domain-containing protein 2 [Hibiscus syriacus]|uniref:Zinc finger CCCH domain-containing protein 2 n=1 Tax=Hibiscus syriacus TaxID=106335 RepID=A0A6A3BRS6_HIBSY|nr:Zinc finger CCCH domain-containing protein 2 [Hibiscus syriacus]
MTGPCVHTPTLVKARRRDPRKFHYSETTCPDFRKGNCKRGDSCEFAHGVFECWLHPALYRTQPYKGGTSCKRMVCFFAHTPEQLRVLPQQNPIGNGSGSSVLDHVGSLMRHRQEFGSSPTSILTLPPLSPSFESPATSPSTPTRTLTQFSLGKCDFWECNAFKEELAMEKLESVRDLRASMYAKLSKEISLGRLQPTGSGPDVRWVSELVN